MKTYCKQTSKLLKSNLQIQCNPYQIINGIFHRIRTKISTLCRRRWWHPTPVLLSGKSHGRRSLVGCSSWGHEESDMIEPLHFHFSLHALEKEMATHSSVLAWRIPGTGEPGGLLSKGSHRVGHDWSDLAAAAAVFHWLHQFTFLSTV